jgi:predicted DsbA family dithiol-disulfide isomerase
MQQILRADFGRVVVTIVTLAFFGAALGAQTSGSKGGKPGIIVALVKDKSISEEELVARVGDRLLALKTQEYTLRKSILNEYLDDILLSMEAEKRGLVVADLVKQEISDRIPPVSESEALAIIESAPPNYDKMSREQAVRVATDIMQQRRIAKRRSEFLMALRISYSPRILLEPPRLSRQLSGGQRSGPSNAPVSITAFSDFQCQPCANLSTTLARLRREYPTKVEIVYKHFPLPMHQQATKAAQASSCAADQKRFWEMHDLLFASQNLVAAGQFDEIANRAGLDVTKFRDCFVSGQSAKEWIKDKTDGLSIGIASTPTFFVNGEMIVGARSYEELREMIDRELQRLELTDQQKK